jgi:hypothetical protein
VRDAIRRFSVFSPRGTYTRLYHVSSPGEDRWPILNLLEDAVQVFVCSHAML